MVGLFRTNQFVANILLVLYILALRFPAFMVEPTIEISHRGGILWELIFGELDSNSNLSFFLAFILIVVIGLLLNIVENKFKLSGELNLLPGASFILIASMLPQSYFLNPTILAVGFFILVFYEILGCYKQFQPATRIFNIGFFLSLAFLFYTSFLLFIPFAIVSLGIVRNLKFQELMMLIIGFVTPILLVGTYCFWMDGFDDFIGLQFTGAISWKSWTTIGSWVNWVPMIFLGLLFVIVLIRFPSFYLKKGIQERKGIDILYWSMVFAGISAVFQPELNLGHLLLLLPCLAYGLSFILLKLSNIKAEAFHFALFLIVIFWQFNPWS